ncbi:hypothetical protein OT109_06970 [Phycisphaeraceae bacterium D3-23]
MLHRPGRLAAGFWVALIACAALLLPACEEGQTALDSPDAGLTEQEGVIHEAVEAMAARGDGASITVTDTDGTPYVKLTMDGRDIVAGLPLSWLPSQQVHTTARELFADAGAAGSSELPGLESTDMFPEFNVSLGDDPDYAAQFAADVLELVYALPPQEELTFETEDD